MPNKNILIFCLLLFSSTLPLSGQIQLVPLSSNEDLLKNQDAGQLATDHYTSTHILNIQAGGLDSFCIDLGFIDGAFDTMEILRPLIPVGGEAFVEKECLTYEADDFPSRVTDSFDLRVLDEDSFEYFFLLVVNVIPSSDIPFIDEFSYEGPYPDPDLWLDRFVYVNFGLAKDPPTIGVATMDGINERGRPYGDRGISDQLTSTFLNLEGATEPVLEFYFQPRGLGFQYLPLEEDSLILEFRNPEGRWVHVYSMPGIGFKKEVPDFEYLQVPIAGNMVYDGFQFRFSNRSGGQGIQSLWHLDYIQVRDKATSQERYPDVALRELPSSLFRTYTAVPSTHFKDFVSSYIADSNFISIGNYFPNLQVMDNSRVLITEQSSGTEILQRSDEENLLKSSAVAGVNQIDLYSGSYKFTNKIQTRAKIVSAINSMNIQEDDSLNFRMTYTFESDERNTTYERNNTLSRDNWVNDFYAYDDGTAEAGVYIQGGREFDMVAVQYETPVDDSLKGVRMALPRVFREGDRQRFKLMVWGAELEDGPIYERFYDDPIFPADYDEIVAGFTNFGLKNDDDEPIAIHIPKGKFHVGYQQVSANTNFGLYVGFDKHNPHATQFIRQNVSGTWDTVSPSIEGALMIRPVFGPKVQRTTSVKVKELLEQLTVFPNPASDILMLKGKFSPQEHQISIVNMKGQEILKTAYRDQLQIGQLTSGMYIMRISDKNKQIRAIQNFIKQ